MLSEHLGIIQPSVAIVLGSGFALELDSVHWQLRASDIPGFVTPTVEGHLGCVTAGTLGRREVLLMQGRVHYYEGNSSDSVTFQVRLANQLNIRNLILISAAGGIRKTLNPGSIMLVEDHICAQPLVATRRERWVYDHSWKDRVATACNDSSLSSGIYVWTIGPSYETPAEIIAFERRGGDAVGMSLVPEALEASALGMRVLAAVVITNYAAGLEEQKLSHKGVLHAATNAQAHLTNLLTVALDQASNLPIVS
ncbi:MAG: purine-nucleoside phosphorylase [Bacteroidetes bacterium]|nr:purine-nucleoside phosphorylase [Bacteroidota bacterium]